MKRAVVLSSGGMDSCVATAIANEENDEIALLHLNYRQRTEKREEKAYLDIANYYQVKKKLNIDTTFLSDIGGSSLTDKSIPVEKNGLKNFDVPSTYVPFRNANILSMAVSWAEVICANKIYIGAVEEDSSGYPDCRKRFFRAFEELIKEGTKKGIRIVIKTPLLSLAKEEIVLLGVKVGAPFHLSWSCYQNEDLACGVCESCLLRLKGFKKAGMEDPIKYCKIN